MVRKLLAQLASDPEDNTEEEDIELKKNVYTLMHSAVCTHITLVSHILPPSSRSHFRSQLLATLRLLP